MGFFVYIIYFILYTPFVFIVTSYSVLYFSAIFICLPRSLLYILFVLCVCLFPFFVFHGLLLLFFTFRIFRFISMQFSHLWSCLFQRFFFPFLVFHNKWRVLIWNVLGFLFAFIRFVYFVFIQYAVPCSSLASLLHFSPATFPIYFALIRF